MERKKLFKVVILGESSAGKTSLLNRYVDGFFAGEYKATIGIDFKSKQILIDGATVQLQLWDTAGQERFDPMSGVHGCGWVRGTDVFVLVVAVDSTPGAALASIKRWYTFCKELEYKEKPFLILGSKKDLMPEEDSAAEKDIKGWATSKGYQYIATSAKEDQGVQQAFEAVARLGLQQIEEIEYPPTACICLPPEQLPKQQNTCGC